MELEDILDMDEVDYVEPNGLMYSQQTVVQPNPPSWGLSRVSQVGLPLEPMCTYKETAGKGVEIHVLDTGIMTTHDDFEDRASWGFVAEGHRHEGEVDLDGHGTHCAGTVGGREHGVAKNATLRAVKVLGGTGSGSFAAMIAGIDWSTAERERTGLPTVISMSLGGGACQAVNQAIDASVASGVHNAISAGNNAGFDACLLSPASASFAFTVAAADEEDNMAFFSNIGPCVDIFAPGGEHYVVLHRWRCRHALTIRH